MERTVLLLHPDRYLTKGLEHALLEWFCSQNIGITIMKNADALLKADIIFTSPHTHSKKWWQQCRRARHDRLLFLLVDRRNILCCGYEDGQLSMSDTPEKLYSLLITHVLHQRPTRVTYPTYQSDILLYLSQREREVLWGYKLGLDNHQISNRSGMTIKAISGYRNNAMQKLYLKNHADLHYWLHTIAADNLSTFFTGTGFLAKKGVNKSAMCEKTP